MKDHYSSYAQFYDQGTTTNIILKTDLIKQKVRELNPKADTLLELACGTGNVLKELLSDYKVTGLDLSTEMLEIAKSKLPDITFHAADMTSFNLHEKFDVIVCLFDSVNHLLTFELWEALFDRAKEHLNTSGVFIMDINTVQKLERFSQHSEHRLEIGNGYQIAKISKDDDSVYHWNLDVYQVDSNGKTQLIKNDVPEVAFPLRQVENALRTRFSKVEAFTPDNSEASEAVDRVYYACMI